MLPQVEELAGVEPPVGIGAAQRSVELARTTGVAQVAGVYFVAGKRAEHGVWSLTVLLPLLASRS